MTHRRCGRDRDRDRSWVWVSALLACGYRVYAINPMSAARYRERHCTSGAKSDAGDAHVLAEIVRVDRDHHRQIAGDSMQVEALKLLARAHQGMIWDRTRHLLNIRLAGVHLYSDRGPSPNSGSSACGSH